jgi:hypothetical protein
VAQQCARQETCHSQTDMIVQTQTGRSGEVDGFLLLDYYYYYYKLGYVMVPLLHTHQRRKQLGVVASCDICQ